MSEVFQSEGIQSLIYPRRHILWLIVACLCIGVVAGVAVGAVGSLALVVFFGMIAVFVTILQPDLGLAAFVVITYLQLSDVLIKFHGLPSIAQPMAVFLVGLVGLRLIFFQEWPARWGNAVLVLGLYSVAVYASIFTAYDQSLAINAFVSFFKDFLGGVVAFFLIRQTSSFKVSIWAAILAGLFMGAISVVQYWTGDFGNEFWGFGGWSTEVSGNVARERLTGPYGNPNAYSQVLITIIPLALERLWHEKKPLLRALAGMSLFCCVLTLMFTFSRGGFLTLLLTVSIFFILFRPRILPILLTLGVIVTLLQFVPAGYLDRISTISQLSSSRPSLVVDESFQGRMSENTAAWRMFLDHPLFGVGVGNYPENYQIYSREIGLDDRREARTPASLYLELLSELGIAGIVAFLVLLFYVFRTGLRANIQFFGLGFTQESYMLRAFLSGLLGYLIAAVVKNSAYANVFWILIGVGLGAVHLAHAQFERKLSAVTDHRFA